MLKPWPQVRKLLNKLELSNESVLVREHQREAAYGKVSIRQGNSRVEELKKHSLYEAQLSRARFGDCCCVNT